MFQSLCAAKLLEDEDEEIVDNLQSFIPYHLTFVFRLQRVDILSDDRQRHS